jgi:CheY-like chemotaxis protein
VKLAITKGSAYMPRKRRQGVKRVLVVDDDERIREMLKTLLEGEGYAVATAADGLEAIEFLVQAQDAWIVLLDVMMPRMSGLEVCARLLAAGPPGTRHAVALMTGSQLDAKDRPPLSRKILDKPFTLPMVLDAVRKLGAALAREEDSPPS